MHKRKAGSRAILPMAVAAVLVGCESDNPTDPQDGLYREYGAAQNIGNGTARTYVVLDGANGDDPVEIGIAISETGLEGLPQQGMVMLRLALPATAPEPYAFATLDWNPHGHEPDQVYTLPHFDFHFYMTSEAEVDAIVPADPNFATKANNVPAEADVPPFYAALAPPGAPISSIAVPQMGVHWSDVRSPELQIILQNPAAHQPFTKTFIYGSWDGEFTFLEPMITRAYLLTKPNETIQVPQFPAVVHAGYYPKAYRITFDDTAKEYRIGLTDLEERD